MPLILLVDFVFMPNICPDVSWLSSSGMWPAIHASTVNNHGYHLVLACYIDRLLQIIYSLRLFFGWACLSIHLDTCLFPW